MIYLSSPYCDADPIVREDRFLDACQAVSHLVQTGEIVFSPVVYSHTLLARMPHTDMATWVRIDRAFLERSEEVVVLAALGWWDSDDVRDEINWAVANDKPVRFMAPVSPRSAKGASGARR